MATMATFCRNNAHLIDDPSLPLPGLKDPALPRGEWVFINQLRSGHCRTTHTLHKCMGQRKQSTCSHCGQQPQTVEHLLHKCPVTRFTGSLIQLHRLQDEEAIDWTSHAAGARHTNSKISLVLVHGEDSHFLLILIFVHKNMTVYCRIHLSFVGCTEASGMSRYD